MCVKWFKSGVKLGRGGKRASPEADGGGGGVWWDEWEATAAERREEERHSKRRRAAGAAGPESDPQWLSSLSLPVGRPNRLLVE